MFSTASYTLSKVFTYGWMDLANPGCGYDASEYAEDQCIKTDTSYDYTFYMMPTVYTLEPGHTLSLVITTYDPFTSNLNQQEDYIDYGFTIDNLSLGVELPLMKCEQ